MGHHLAGFLRGGVWNEEIPRGGNLGWNFQPNIPDSLDIRMPGAGVMLQPKHPRVFEYRGACSSQAA